MRRLSIGVLDIATKGPSRTLYSRVLHTNYASIMPQAVAAWCEEEGHLVSYLCYTGREDPALGLPEKLDLVFISAFTHAGQLSYALSNMFRSRGTVTALGGPHARCYPHDARRYFDYVLGFTDKALIKDVLRDCARHRPVGLHLSADRHPAALPGVRERWKFIEMNLRRALWLKVVPMLSSLGCPYNCSFCVDAAVSFQPLDFDQIQDDLRFLMDKFKRPQVGWHDPNFGVRFDDCMGAIEEAVPPGSIEFIAESSLALLSESRAKRLSKNGCRVLLPGIESWYDMGRKSKTGKSKGLEKVHMVSEQVNMLLRHIPYIHCNFIVGLDTDQGCEPFELTKRFLDLTPGVFPSFMLLVAYGEGAPLNVDYQRQGRVLPLPFHFLGSQVITNVRPRHYGWTEFYDLLIDMEKYAFSWSGLAKRLAGSSSGRAGLMALARGVSQERRRIKDQVEVRRQLSADRQMRSFFEQKTREIPRFCVDLICRDLGPFWKWLPEGALSHEQNTFLGAEKPPPSGDEMISTAAATRQFCRDR